ncbi:MAG: nucleotide exchange factor GrpE [Chitinophagales bacterium]
MTDETKDKVTEEEVKETSATTDETTQEETQVEETPKTELEILQEDNAKLQRQIQEQKDKYLRLFADFDNFKKRTAKERLDLLNTAGKDIILSILPTLDDFDRAIGAAENAEDVTSVKEGMLLIQNKMKSQLEQRGLKPMETKGEAFDAEFHEAITEIPAPSEDMKGKIIDEIEKGYTMGGKIIRYAKVVVGK